MKYEDHFITSFSETVLPKLSPGLAGQISAFCPKIAVWIHVLLPQINWQSYQDTTAEK